MLKKKQVDEWQGEINITGVYAPCQTTIFGLSLVLLSLESFTELVFTCL